jgi:hypothetical protein
MPQQRHRVMINIDTARPSLARLDSDIAPRSSRLDNTVACMTRELFVCFPTSTLTRMFIADHALGLGEYHST